MTILSYEYSRAKGWLFVEPLSVSLRRSLSAIPWKERTTTAALEALQNLRWSARVGYIFSHYVAIPLGCLCGIALIIAAAYALALLPISTIGMILRTILLFTGLPLFSLSMCEFVFLINGHTPMAQKIGAVFEEKIRVLDEWIEELKNNKKTAAINIPSDPHKWIDQLPLNKETVIINIPRDPSIDESDLQHEFGFIPPTVIGS